jgi:hypothetical protein
MIRHAPEPAITLPEIVTDPARVTNSTQILKSLISARSPNGPQALPALREAPPQESWLQQILTRMTRAVTEWLDHLFSASKSPIEAESVILMMKILLFICAIAVVGLIFYLIFSRLRRSRSFNPAQPERAFITPEDRALAELKLAIALAVEKRAWAAAARLRWKLQLKKVRAQPSLTPREFFKRDKAALMTDLADRLMFDTDMASETEYRKLEAAIESLGSTAPGAKV